MLKFVVLCFVMAVLNAQQHGVNDDILCEGRVFEPNCTVGTVQITYASYGKTDSWFCSGPQRQPWSTNCAGDVTQQVRATCQDKQTCSMPVAGADSCAGAFKYLRVLWQCSSGNVQARVNNKNSNILLSSTRNRANSVPLHNGNVVGSDNYIFVEPSGGIQQVRWYLDNMTRVFTTETAAPWEMLGGQRWDTMGNPRVPDGQHRIVAAITFSDGTSGVVDASFNVRNGANNNNNNGAGRALERTSVTFTQETTTVVTENQIVPWSLFGTTVAAIIALSVVIGVMDRKKKTMVERA